MLSLNPSILHLRPGALRGTQIFFLTFLQILQFSFCWCKKKFSFSNQMLCYHLALKTPGQVFNQLLTCLIKLMDTLVIGPLCSCKRQASIHHQELLAKMQMFSGSFRFHLSLILRETNSSKSHLQTSAFLRSYFSLHAFGALPSQTYPTPEPWLSQSLVPLQKGLQRSASNLGFACLVLLPRLAGRGILPKPIWLVVLLALVLDSTASSVSKLIQLCPRFLG